VNHQQQTAIEFPCQLAEQCSQQRYRKVTRRKVYFVSVVLTINIGEE